MSTNKIVLSAFCAVALCSCTAAKQKAWFVSNNGNMPPEERIAKIHTGATKDDVIQILGAPSAVSSFNDNTWIYMSSEIKCIAFMKPEEIERNILKISFNNDGQIIAIDRLSKNDGKDIEPVADKTEVKGQNPGFFRKYFGGVGQYNPFAGQNSATGM